MKDIFNEIYSNLYRISSNKNKEAIQTFLEYLKDEHNPIISSFGKSYISFKEKYSATKDFFGDGFKIEDNGFFINLHPMASILGFTFSQDLEEDFIFNFSISKYLYINEFILKFYIYEKTNTMNCLFIDCEFDSNHSLNLIDTSNKLKKPLKSTIYKDVRWQQNLYLFDNAEIINFLLKNFNNKNILNESKEFEDLLQLNFDMSIKNDSIANAIITTASKYQKIILNNQELKNNKKNEKYLHTI